MTEREDFSGLDDLRKTLTDATEVLAAFISTGRSNEQPIASLMEAADKILPELREWRKTIETVVDMVERDAVH